MTRIGPNALDDARTLDDAHTLDGASTLAGVSTLPGASTLAHYLPDSFFLNWAVSAGTTSFTSPTIP